MATEDNATQAVPIPTLTAPSLYPSPSEAALKLQFVGKQIKDVQAPAVIIDAAVARRNCKLMLETTQKLGVDFRAHVKTHKVSLNKPFRPYCADEPPDYAIDKVASRCRVAVSQACRFYCSRDREPASMATGLQS